MHPAVKRQDMPQDPTFATALNVLERVFGYHSFRLHQSAIIETILAGRDALVLMPTGGASLCVIRSLPSSGPAPALSSLRSSH
jgi:ATP-dependent DNA helicase RecQ